MATSFYLPELLENRRWAQERLPFPHIHALNVFTPAFYQSLAEQFESLMKKGYGQNERGKFNQGTSWYQAHTFHMNPETDGPLSIFLSRPWHDMLATLFDINSTNDVQALLHHHPAGNGSGWIHNDLNPGWFVDHPKADGINVDDKEISDYSQGKVHKGNKPARETMRAIALLYYLNNEPWQYGDGGETGLYYHQTDRVDTPARGIPPVNNTLVAFECTPYSYHTFINNRRNPRNSVIMWLHRPKPEAVARWGEGAIEYWRKRG